MLLENLRRRLQIHSWASAIYWRLQVRRFQQRSELYPKGLRENMNLLNQFQNQNQAPVQLSETERLNKKVLMMRELLQQYQNDLAFWWKAHANDYPKRRYQEVTEKMQEIEAL